MAILEEDLKNVLKGLFFANKKQQGFKRRFQEKLQRFHSTARVETQERLKEFLEEKAKQEETLRKQWAQARSVIKHLMQHVNRLREERNEVKEGVGKEITLLTKQKNEACSSLEQKKKLICELEKSKQEWAERLEESLKQIQDQSGMIVQLNEENAQLRREHSQRELSLKQMEKRLFELHKGVERNAVLEQDLIQQKKENENLVNQLKIKEEEKTALRKEMDAAHAQWQETHFASAQRKMSEKLEQAEREIEHLSQGKAEVQKRLENFQAAAEEKEEQLLALSYEKMREMSDRHASLAEKCGLLEKVLKEKSEQIENGGRELEALQTALFDIRLQCEEKDGEIRKAQHHLAKKVKETTLLQDLLERQKGQFGEFQKTIEEQNREIGLLHKKVQAYKLQIHEAEEQNKKIKEWEERYSKLQGELARKEDQLKDLEKIQKDYELLSSQLKNLLS